MQSLHIERDKYLKLEKRIKNFFVAMLIVFLTPNLFTLWGFVLFENGEKDDYIFYLLQNIYQFGCLGAALLIY